MEDNIPKTLYKYRTWKNVDNKYNYHKDIIIKDEIYFASPIHFNDPFDCKVHIRYDLETDEYVRSRITEHVKDDNPTLNESEVINIVKEQMSLKLWKDPNNLNNSKEYTQNLIDSSGIFSLTKFNNNILMWSHYADSHKSYCVGFNTEKLDSFFEGYSDIYDTLITIIKVNYFKKYPIFLPSELDEVETLIKPISAKANNWKYEDEFRCLYHKHADKNFKLPPDIIESVYLGCEMPLDDRQEILRILSTKPYRIKLYKASLEENKFGLQFKEVKF